MFRNIYSTMISTRNILNFFLSVLEQIDTGNLPAGVSVDLQANKEKLMENTSINF